MNSNSFNIGSGRWSAKRTNPISFHLGLIYRVSHGSSCFYKQLQPSRILMIKEFWECGAEWWSLDYSITFRIQNRNHKSYGKPLISYWNQQILDFFFLLVICLTHHQNYLSSFLTYVICAWSWGHIDHRSLLENQKSSYMLTIAPQ